MPELPEIETVRRGIAPWCVGRICVRAIVRCRQLRRPVSQRLQQGLTGATILDVRRRAKYLLLESSAGSAILHLGMSGTLRIVPAATAAEAHDHIDLIFDDGMALRLRDPRRFGLAVWTTRRGEQHPLLARLGPEPFDDAFSGAWLRRRAEGRRVAVKPFLMDGATVAGVGNIYAAESLFRAGIDPRRAAGRISLARYARLAEAVRETLAAAIEAGGTTLRDFRDGRGQTGWFQTALAVYGREGAPCPRCAAPVRRVALGQRSSFYCPACQR